MKLSLDLAVATHRAEGIARVASMILPPQHGVRYVVSWQNHGGAPIPQALMRDDVEVFRFDGIGYSNNRNNALDHCKADIVLEADDDLTYLPDSFDKIRSVFENNPQVDLATFRARYDYPKEYPADECTLGKKLPRNYWVATFEIAFRRKSVGSLRCHPLLGLGAPDLQVGEDEFFLMSAIRRGYHCRFFPIEICLHEHPSSGTGKTLTPGALRGLGFIVAAHNPLTWPLRIPLKAWRIHKAGMASFGHALRYLLGGVRRLPSVLRSHPEATWL